MNASAVQVHIQRALEHSHPWFEAVDNAQLRRWARACFLDPAELTLRFVDVEEGRALNSQFRGKDYATNVLTFPMDMPNLGPDSGLPTFCADIIICPDVVEQEAIQQKKTPLNHLAHLVIHGCLHAQGYVHDSEGQARVMESREIELLKRFRIDNPYWAKD